MDSAPWSYLISYSENLMWTEISGTYNVKQ